MNTPLDVFLATDHVESLAEYSTWLGNAGLNVVAKVATEALEPVTVERNPDVIAVDLCGDYTARLNRSLEQLALSFQCPVLILTEAGRHFSDMPALQEKGWLHLVKPCRPGRLLDALKSLAWSERRDPHSLEWLKKHFYEREREHLALDQHAIVSIADRSGKITYVNDLFCQVSGYNANELLGQTHRIVKSDQHSADFYRDMWHTIAGGAVWQGEICNRRKDGSLYWVESTITPFMDVQGLPYQYVSIRTDITGVKMAEEKLRRQSAMQELLTTSAASLLASPADSFDDVIVYTLKMVGTFLDADSAALVLIGNGKARVRIRCDLNTAGRADKGELEDGRIRRLLQRLEQGLLCSSAVEKTNPLNVELQGVTAWLSMPTLLLVPLRRNVGIEGFIAFGADGFREAWKGGSVKLLSLLGDMLCSAIARCRSEEALIQHRERLRRGQISANIGTWEWDLVTGALFWSERIAPLFGYRAGEVETCYESFLRAVHPDDRHVVSEAVAACIERDQPYEVEHRVLHPDGQVRWLLERGAVVRDESGKAIKMLGVVQDISERKQAQLELVERERQLNEAQALAHLGSWKANLQTGEVLWSDEVYRIFGVEPGVYRPGLRSFLASVHPEDVPAVRDALRRAESTGLHDIVHRIVRPDGSVRHVHELAQTVNKDAGRIVELSGTIQDISERIEAERRICDTEDRFTFAVEGAGDGVWDWDLTTNAVQCSGLYAQMLGYDNCELPQDAESWLQGIHPQDRARVQTHLEAFLDGHQKACSQELRMRCRDGHYKWILCRASIVKRDSAGKPLRMIGIQSDISEQKKAEMALIRARQEAERANRAKTEFLSCMSHELRTPMNAILGFSQVLQYDHSLPMRHQRNVQEILRAGQHLLQLINEVLDLARVESGHVELSPEPVALEPVVRECMGILTSLAEKRRIRLLAHGLAGTAVRADRTRLKQVLLNLLSNAIKYNLEDGEVRVAVDVASDGRYRIGVSDTGVGIPEHRLAELFQPFNRLGADKSDVEGTGIGLTLSRRLVELMDGQVGVASAPGEGTLFWIELPAAVPETVPGEAPLMDTALGPLAPARLASTSTVLYIDDNPSNLELMRQVLDFYPGIELLTSQSPEEGIEIAMLREPALILVDINMPGLDGYRVLEILQRWNIAGATPVIAVTASAMDRDVKKGRAAGFADYLTKPIDIPRLIKVVERCLAPAREAETWE